MAKEYLCPSTNVCHTTRKNKQPTTPSPITNHGEEVAHIPPVTRTGEILSNLVQLMHNYKHIIQEQNSCLQRFKRQQYSLE